MVRPLCLIRISALFALAGLAPALAANEVVLSSVADATLIERAPDSSSGGADFFNSGTTQANTRNRGLFQFDLTSQIPAGATITSATLQLQVVKEAGCGLSQASTFGIYRMLRSWGEGSTLPLDNRGGLGGPAQPGDATWNSPSFGTSQTWGTPGGAAGIDYVPNFSGSALIYGRDQSPYGFESNPETVGDVQFWLDHPNANFGWMLISSSEDTSSTARGFASREDLLGRGPTLTVD